MIGNGDAKTCFARVGQNDVIPGAPSLKSKAFEHASNALARIKGKVFDAHLSVNKFDLWRLDADRLLFCGFDIESHVLPTLHQVFEDD
jgi:hypothetical protein